ncbi:paraquat-inducible protein A [Ferrimonas sediminum]|uniref:Paraquat-inducible protein A n=1 Tax=Ferrimonas sediminum TaxID=718193 RepID=A0A1G8VY23_9GAMM|nr:paraquat-inducible protein A [Ferrimonas sediminum]SDJ70942.1 paraquat-inducible protein A [Ferrimonas sediminum]
MRLFCPRCQSRLADSPYCDHSALAALALTALILFIPANLLPILEVNLLGSVRQATIAFGAVITFEQGFWLVGTAIFTAGVLAPLLVLISILGQLILLKLKIGKSLARQLIKWHPMLDQIAMLEVYLISFLVAAFKLGDFADLHYGAGTFCFMLLFVITFYVQYEYNHDLMWQRYDQTYRQ